MSTSTLNSPLMLPCGAQLKNRIVKAAMSDSLGDGVGNATDTQARLYRRWAEGGVALSIIGEVQVTPYFPEKPGNLVLTPQVDVAALRHLADQGTHDGAHLWPQLGHAGALSHAPISEPAGPSALDVPGLRCRALSRDEIAALPQHYAQAAEIARQTGFTGVQIHAGHGFLLSQFLSPLFNRRQDDYGGSVANRFRLIEQIITAVRATVGADFPIGIKINSTDKLAGGLTQIDALEVIRLLDNTSVDLIDISGGTYFPGATASSDDVSRGGPYFAQFAQQAKLLTQIPIALTGGFTKQQQATEVVVSGQADAVSLARALALEPDLANQWLARVDADPVFPRFNSTPSGGITAWYSLRLTALGEGEEGTFDHDPETALAVYDQRDNARCAMWRQAFMRN